MNKSGGLVYNKDFSPQSPQLGSNEHLRLASTLFGMQQIANQVSTIRSLTGSGINQLVAPTFILEAMSTVTGTLFFLTAEIGTANLREILREVYVLYTDYVMKNPFHQLEMPIRSELFDINLNSLIQRGGGL
eukprot:SAG22_NODE_2540_length_2463_cov_5.358714_2_plen_132_part_00